MASAATQLSAASASPPPPPPPVAMSAAHLLECSSLYDLSSSDLSERLSSLVSSVSSAGADGPVPMDLDRFVAVERQILLIHQELRERHLAEQLARDPWMDSELDERPEGVELGPRRDQPQQPYHAAADAATAASSSAARAASVSSGLEHKQQQQWANQHADRRGLEEARRRAGGAHGPVRSGHSGAAAAPTKKPKPGASGSGGGGSSGGGGGGSLAIPANILNQRREMVIMTSSVNNRRHNKPAAGASSSAKKKTAGAGAMGAPPLPAGSLPLHSPSSATPSAASSQRSHSSSASSASSSSLASSALKRSASVGSDGRSAGFAAGSAKKKKVKPLPELSVTQKAKQYAAAQKEARRSASASKIGGASPALSQRSLSSDASATTTTTTTTTAMTAAGVSHGDAVSATASTVDDGSGPGSVAPSSARSASSYTDSHVGTESAPPSRLYPGAAADEEEEFELDGSYSSDGGGNDGDDGATGLSAQSASGTSVHMRVPPSAYASMDHAAIAAAQFQGAGIDSSHSVPDLLRSPFDGAHHAGEIEEQLESHPATHEVHARSDAGRFDPLALPHHDADEHPPLPRRPWSPPRSRSHSPVLSARGAAAAAEEGAVEVRPVDVRVSPLNAADDDHDDYSDGSYSDAQLSDPADDDESDAKSLRKAPRLPLGGADGSATAVGAGGGISATEWAKAAAAGDSVLRKLQRKAGRIAPRNAASIASGSSTTTSGALSSPTSTGPAPASSPTGRSTRSVRVASDPRREAEKALARHAKLREADRAAAAAAAAAAAQQDAEDPAAAGKPKRRTAKEYLEGVMGTKSSSAAATAAAKTKSQQDGKTAPGGDSKSAGGAGAGESPDSASSAVAVVVAPRVRRPARPPLVTHPYELYFPGGSLEYMFSAMWSAHTAGALASPAAAGGGGPPPGHNWFSAMVAQIAQVEKFKNAMWRLTGGVGGGAGGGSGAASNGSAQSLARQRANEIRAEYLPASMQNALVPSVAAASAAAGLPAGSRLSSADVRAMEQSRTLKAQRMLLHQSYQAARPSSSSSSAGGGGGGDDDSQHGGGGFVDNDSGDPLVGDEAAARDMGPGGHSAALIFLVTHEREEVYTVVRQALLALKDDDEGEEEQRQEQGEMDAKDAATTLPATESDRSKDDKSAADESVPSAPTAPAAAPAVSVPAAATRPRRPPAPVWMECPVEDAPKPDRLFPFLPPNFTTAVIGAAPSPPPVATPLPLYANPPSAVAAEKAAAAASAAAAKEKEKEKSVVAAADSLLLPPSGMEFSSLTGQFHGLGGGGGGGLGGVGSSLGLGLGMGASVGGPSLYWNLLWTWKKPHLDWSKLLVWQRVNHFPDSRVLTRKDLLKKALERFSTHRGYKFAREWAAVMPQSFILPQEFQGFLEAFTRAAVDNETARLEGGHHAAAAALEPNYWICKPPSLSRGRGIFVASRIEDIDLGAPLLVQRYIPNPLLLDGHKFDLRLYVLVTSTQPLEAFVYREGFARISTARFSTNEADLKNKFIHLTNSSVQKNNILTRDGKEIGGAGVDDHARQQAANGSAAGAAAGGNRTGDPRFDRPAGTGTGSSSSSSTKQPLSSPIFADPLGDGGSKISLAHLWTLLRVKGVDVPALWSRIVRILLQTLVAVEDSIAPCVNSFELFGFDVLIDANLRAHLIEVNASPSMGLDTPLDRRIKPRLVRDTVLLVDPQRTHRNFIGRLLQRRATSGEFMGTPPKSREAKVRAARETLHHVLQGGRPRLVGEAPGRMGLFERLAPNTQAHDAVMRMKRAAFQPPSGKEHAYRRTLPPLA